MADGFSVRANVVAAGSGRMRSLESEAQGVAGTAASALEGMTGAAGYPELTEALASMTSTAVTMFAIAGMAFERSAGNHAQTAQGYRDSEARTVEAIGRIGGGIIR
jgi:hypothetical protein